MCITSLPSSFHHADDQVDVVRFSEILCELLRWTHLIYWMGGFVIHSRRPNVWGLLFYIFISRDWECEVRGKKKESHESGWFVGWQLKADEIYGLKGFSVLKSQSSV